MPEELILRRPAAIVGNVEICRSFAYKLNVGNYESRDFFTSQKASCRPEDAEEISASLQEFCEMEVLAAVKEYRRKVEGQRERKTA
jgi:hypothetical protein